MSGVTFSGFWLVRWRGPRRRIAPRLRRPLFGGSLFYSD